ncbi:hypothetical protein [Pseudomonas amygdali]|uniref:hypothetical protein n=1 Tax=Pseudomonas amygdali TaxID=47877 RepID=UPI0009B966A0|nr:hypothetical protein [Pseudomonas amygdali]
MTFNEALKYFGTGRAIGDALAVTSSRVSQCRTAGGFSYPMQCVLEKESSGALVARGCCAGRHRQSHAGQPADLADAADR